ncbi:MAG: HU family DNA-binding protein [Gracilimonas sp.]|nr:HU family DNA-binding protein [Gracilimonas sp.]
MSEKVTYSEIIEALSQKTGFSKNKSEAFSKALIAQIKEELEETGKASITNFGSFKVKEIAERQGQNPQTGEPIIIPAHKRVTFSPYKALREVVNAKYAHLESELIEESDQSVKAESVAEQRKADAGTEKVTHQRKRVNNNLLVMITAILVVAVIAMVSAWFLLNTEDKEVAQQQSQSSVESSNVANPLGSQVENEGPKMEQVEASADQKTQQTDETEIKEGDMGATESEMRTYRVKTNEWYWVISKNIYGKSQFWPLLFQENFTTDHHPDSIAENTELKIPELQGEVGNLERADYQRLFEAAMMVAEAYHNAGLEEKAYEYARYSRNWERAANQ